jgi:hypothetical protein
MSEKEVLMSWKAMILTLALLALPGALPSQAGEAMTPAPVPVGVSAPAPSQAGCVPDLDRLLQPKASGPAQGEVCSAATMKSAAQPFPAPVEPLALGRTCRCSCGQPCQTDADCGVGGRCTAGITCC